MNQNDRYAPFRPELTAEQRERIEKSDKPGKEYGRIAAEEAKKQFALLKNPEGKTVVLPDDPDICLRFPGIDPRGVYSTIDMRFKSRMHRLDAVLNLREARDGAGQVRCTFPRAGTVTLRYADGDTPLTPDLRMVQRLNRNTCTDGANAKFYEGRCTITVS